MARISRRETTLAEDLLVELCRARVTLSAVSLAGEMYDRGRLQQVGDPYGLVLWTLQDMNKAGDITYRLGHNSVPVEIRVTRDGYKRAGFTVRHHEVGNIRRGAPAAGPSNREDGIRHSPGDGTEFYNHPDKARGSEVERMPIRQHIRAYPQHDHRRWLHECIEIEVGRMGPPQAEVYMSTTDELERIARVVPTAVAVRSSDLKDPLDAFPLTKAAIDEDETKHEPVRRAAVILRNSGNTDLADLVEQEANVEYDPLLKEAMAMGRLIRGR